MTAATDTSRSRKGRNFSNEEEMQVCRSQLCILQDPIVGNGQRKEAFWDRVSTHYNRHWPRGLGESSARSIETKWGVIKHDVSKFCAVYGHCYDNRESGQSLDDILQAALELYKVQQARNQPIVYFHCWYLLKDHPRWMEMPGERSQRTLVVLNEDESKRQSFSPLDVNEDDADIVGGEEGAQQAKPTLEQRPTVTPTKRGRLIGVKFAKEEQRQRLAREHIAKVTQWVTCDMAMANFRKAQVLEDQAALQIFTMPHSEELSDQAHEYLDLWREEDLLNLRVRVVEKKAALAREEAAKKKVETAAARKRTAREEELQAAEARRNPPTAPQRAAPTSTPHIAPTAPQRSTPTPTTRQTAPPRPARQRAPGPRVAPAPPISQQTSPPASPVADQSPRCETQEEAVSETQEDYLSSPTTARLLASIATRQQQLVPPGTKSSNIFAFQYCYDTFSITNPSVSSLTVTETSQSNGSS
jgi:hypothetical protein